MDGNDFTGFIDPHLKARVKELGRLAAPPHVTLELMRLLQDERTTTEQLRNLVEQDPALSAKVISLGNSSFYGLKTPVKTIDRAITVIGFSELQFLALALGLVDTFDLRRAPEGFNGEALWLHSLSLAWVAGEAARADGRIYPGEAMLAGLLHNIGQIAMITKFPEQLRLVLKTVEQGQTFLEAEAGLGLSHEVLGSFLARSWGMPQYLQDVIHYHHRPGLSPEGSRGHVALVSLALEVVDRTEFRLEHEGPLPVEPFLFEPAHRAIEPAHRAIEPAYRAIDEEKLLRKALHTLPLMAPAWLQMMAERPRKDERS